MTNQDIQCFLKLAQTLNYTKTAQLLYISQPAVTRHIHSVEAEVGAQLFDRSVRREVQLTEAGEMLYHGLKQCEKIYEDTLNSIKLHTEQALILFNLMRGTTLPDSFVQATTEYMREQPAFRHFTNFIDYDNFRTVMDRGEILICAKELMPQEKIYQSMKLNSQPVPYYIVASKKHKAFKNSQNVQLDEIASTSLFLPKTLPMHLRNTFKETMLGLFGKLPKETIYLDSTDSVSLFLRSNECFTICTGWNTDVFSSDFRSIKLPLCTDYYVMWHGDKPINSIARGYLEKLRKSGS